MALYANMTVAEAFDEAFENIGVAPSAITAEHIDSARRSVKRLLTAWNNDSVNFWKVSPGQTHAQTILEQSFVLPAGTIDLLSMGIIRNGYLTPVLLISRDDWFNISDKDGAQGMATRVWIERDVEPPVAHVYPKAENSTDVLIWDAMVWFNDSSAMNAAPDIGQLWNDAFITGLEWYLSRKYAPMRIMEKQSLYGGPGTDAPSGKGAYGVARMGNRERGDTVMIRRRVRGWRRA